MRFSQQILENIRAIIPASQIVGRRVKLKRQGREWSGLCCFHAEKSPSLTVNDPKNLFHCFGCGAHGDQFGFLMQSEGLSFPEAVERLAHEAGLELPKADPEAIKKEAKRLTIIEVLEEAQRFFVAALKANREPRAYLAARRVSNEAVEKFGIGYAPDERSALKGALASDLGIAAEAGLVVTGEEIPVSYDRFRHRITIPIRDLQGRIIGFGGRGLGETAPKYLNSPETPAFHKGSVLFNAHNARQPAHDGEPVIVQEGYFDVISTVMAGFPATVGTMGTAITEGHLLGLWRLSDTPAICFDGDAAGRRAAAKAILTAFPLLLPGRSLRFIAMPAGMDPDQLIRDRGAATFRRAVEGSAGLADTFWRASTENRSLASPDAQARLEADMMAAISQIPDDQLRRKYSRDAKDRIYRLPRRTMIVRANGFSNHSTAPGSIRLTHGIEERAGFSLKEAVIVAGLVKNPDAADPEKTDDHVSERVKNVLSEIFYLISSVPESELQAAMHVGDLGRVVSEALDVCHQNGIRSFDA